MKNSGFSVESLALAHQQRTTLPYEPPMKTIQRFASREEAGRALAKHLAKFSGRPDVIVLALPNGGVPVGAEIAALLDKPFDVLLVEQIVAPERNGMTVGAITCGGVRMLNGAMIDRLHLSPSEISRAVLEGSQKLARREQLWHEHSIPLEVADHTVILVDDGTTPCSSIRDAIRLLRRQHADQVIVAVPTACRDATCDLRMEADEVVALAEPATTRTVRKWHQQLPRTTDEDVHHLLAPAGRARNRCGAVA